MSISPTVPLVHHRSLPVALPTSRRTLADALRDDCGLTGTHLGCEHGVCGACTVLVDDEPIRSCLMFAVQAQDHSIATVEGLRSEEHTSELQSLRHIVCCVMIVEK